MKIWTNKRGYLFIDLGEIVYTYRFTRKQTL